MRDKLNTELTRMLGIEFPIIKAPMFLVSNAEMINIIGDQITFYKKKKYTSNEFFFDYLKKETKYKRKMGHLTTLIK